MCDCSFGFIWLHDADGQLIPHQTLHLFTGFIRLPNEQLNARENSTELDTVPQTLKKIGQQLYRFIVGLTRECTKLKN